MVFLVPNAQKTRRPSELEISALPLDEHMFNKKFSSQGFLSQNGNEHTFIICAVFVHVFWLLWFVGKNSKWKEDRTLVPTILEEENLSIGENTSTWIVCGWAMIIYRMAIKCLQLQPLDNLDYNTKKRTKLLLHQTCFLKLCKAMICNKFDTEKE